MGNGNVSGVNQGGPAQGPSSHHMVHHPSLHQPRTAKSLLHEAESMESLLSAHSQQQQMAHAQVCTRSHSMKTVLMDYDVTLHNLREISVVLFMLNQWLK